MLLLKVTKRLFYFSFHVLLCWIFPAITYPLPYALTGIASPGPHPHNNGSCLLSIQDALPFGKRQKSSNRCILSMLYYLVISTSIEEIQCGCDLLALSFYIRFSLEFDIVPIWEIYSRAFTTCMNLEIVYHLLFHHKETHTTVHYVIAMWQG